MAEKGGQPHRRDYGITHPQKPPGEYGNEPFQHVTQQGDNSGFPAADAQYIGGAGVAGALGAGIGEPQQFAGDNCCGQGAQQVGGENKKPIEYHLDSVPD